MAGSGQKKTVSAKVPPPIHEEIETYREVNDCSKTDAVIHFLTLGIQTDNGQVDNRARGASALNWHLLGIAAQTTVVAIVILMIGPGVGMVPNTTAFILAATLLMLAWWLAVAVRLDLVDRVTDMVFKDDEPPDPTDPAERST